jgi:hypothetical protein
MQSIQSSYFAFSAQAEVACTMCEVCFVRFPVFLAPAFGVSIMTLLISTT